MVAEVDRGIWRAFQGIAHLIGSHEKCCQLLIAFCASLLYYQSRLQHVRCRSELPGIRSSRQ